MKIYILIPFLLFGLLFVFNNCSNSTSEDAVQVVDPLPVDPPEDDGDDDQEEELLSDEILNQIPDLKICNYSGTPFIEYSESSPDNTYFQECAQVCSGDWSTCTSTTMVRGREQTELYFVVDEDGTGRGFGGHIRFTKNGDKNKLVVLHKGGSGTDWVEDFLPNKIEEAGGVAFQPKWNQQGKGWFSRPFTGSSLTHNLRGISLRPAAVFKWIYLNLQNGKISSAACSGGSIATFYPRHWHGLDPLFKYQLMAGGPVITEINTGCSGGGVFLGRCTLKPQVECQMTSDCGGDGGNCSPYEWSGGIVMAAVRTSMDHLHAQTISVQNQCFNRIVDAAFDVSNWNNTNYSRDFTNEHKIDFLFNLGSTSSSDEDLSLVSQAANVYSTLTGPKSWNFVNTGIHCDALNVTDEGWNLLRVGADL